VVGLNVRGKGKNTVQRDYEVTFIVRIEGTDDQINEVVDTAKNWVEADGVSKVNKIDRWGRRKLAYEIERQREGYYVLFDASIDGKHMDELERNLSLAPQVLRHLVVRKDE
jgi:small subunit ribosomal protein S6